MITALLFAVACLAFGYAAMRYLRLSDAEGVAFALVAGVLAGGWLTLLLSWFVFDGTGSASILAATAMLALGAALVWKKTSQTKKEPKKKNKIVLLLFVAALAFLLLNLRCTLEPDASGGLVSVINVWGDGPFHYGLVNSFANGGNLPPEYPVLAGTRLAYPFLMDYYSGVLVAGGLDLRSAIVYPNAFVFFALLCGAYALFNRLGGKRAALLGILLFFANGNAGVLAGAENGFALDRDYSHLEDAGLYFMNLTYSLFVPQRSILLGYAIACVVFVFLYDYVFARGNRRSLLVAGVLAGLSLFAHAHSALAIGLVAAALFAFKPNRDWLWFVAPAVLLGFPQLLWMLGQAQSGLSGIHVGWLVPNESLNILELFIFWLRNAWLVLVLGTLGFFYAKKETKKFVLPFAFFFALGNLVRFQAWDWDNIKIVSYWFFAWALLAGVFLDKLLDSGKKVVRRAAPLLVFLAIASALLTFAWMCWGSNARYQVYSAGDLALAEWVKTNTPADAVFITADAPQDPVSSLAGRRVVLGFKGWLWSHGLNYRSREKPVEAFYAAPSCLALDALGADYALVSFRENALAPNVAGFEANLTRVYASNGYTVYSC
ncbi:MAG: DUF6798 domain-containing protein [Candidatus Micrarchaeia archaeon]